MGFCSRPVSAYALFCYGRARAFHMGDVARRLRGPRARGLSPGGERVTGRSQDSRSVGRFPRRATRPREEGRRCWRGAPTACSPSGKPASPASRGRLRAGAPRSVQVAAKIGSPVPSSAGGASPTAAGVKKCVIGRDDLMEELAQAVAPGRRVEHLDGGEGKASLDDADYRFRHLVSPPFEVGLEGLGHARAQQDVKRRLRGLELGR